MNEQASRIAACVHAYDAQGWHRTGSDVDVASGNWLAGEIEALGFETRLEPYELSRIAVRQAYLEVGGRRIDGLPLFDGGFTDEAGVTGRLGAAGSGADIALLQAEGEAAAQDLSDLRRGAIHKALVLVTAGRRPGLMAHNASDFNHPFGPPALQVSSEEQGWLETQAARGASATIVAVADRIGASSANVVARWPGSNPEAAPVVVTTPRSGWWHCASERGGGLAAWLQVARKVVEAAPAGPVWFVAFSGHELGHLGSNAFLEPRPEMVHGARAWVHFGANVGGATEPAVRVSASSDDLLAGTRDALLAAGVSGVTAAPVGRVLGLESGDITRRGGRCISLLGGNAFFHLESDRWPEAVDVASVASQANAFGDLVVGLASQDV